MKKYILTLLAAVATAAVAAQSGSSLFDDTVLHEIRLEISLPNWPDTLANDYQRSYNDPDLYPEVERRCEVAWVDGKRLENVGFRERGNFSNQINRKRLKKPFKVVFDAFDDDQRYEGLKSVNLNNCTNDPAMVREALTYRLLRDLGQPAPRTSYARFYVNDAYLGLYLLVENVDKTFLRDLYGPQGNDGNLYKTGHGAAVTLEWRGDSAAGYEAQNLELKTNEDEADWSQFIHFVDVVNHTPVDSLPEKLPAVFDVDNYLKILAVEKLVFSWDSYWGGGNNFYLYEHPDGRIRWLPWDFNESFQDFDGGVLGALVHPSFLIPSNQFDERPLLKAIFSVPAWKQQYLDEVCALLQSGGFGSRSMAEQATAWRALIDEACAEDDNALFPYATFKTALTEHTTEYVVVPTSSWALKVRLAGLLPFVNGRVAWAQEQMGFHDYTCDLPAVPSAPYDLTLQPNPTHHDLRIGWAGADAATYAHFSVWNFLGQQVLDAGWQVSDNEEFVLDVSQLPNGVFTVVKQDVDRRWAVGRFVKF